MKAVLEFVNQLHVNNNKAWFDAHRDQYEAALEEFRAFVGKLIEGIRAFDPMVGDVAAKDTIFRIYRDTRFSHNKDPYKPWMGAYISPGGKSSGYAGYYFHVEAREANYIGGHILAAGVYMPMGKELESIRTEILDDPKAFLAAMAGAKGFSMEGNDMLKKVPAGFPPDFEHADLLRYKDYSLWHKVDDAYMLSPRLPDNALAEYRTTSDFVKILNRAIDYAKKEM